MEKAGILDSAKELPLKEGLAKQPGTSTYQPAVWCWIRQIKIDAK